MKVFENVDVDALADALTGKVPETEEEKAGMQRALSDFMTNYEKERAEIQM